MARSKSSERMNFARVLAGLGAIIAMVGFVIGSYEAILANDIVGILLQLVGAIVSILVLIQTGFIKKWRKIPFKWWMLLTFVIVQVLLNDYTNLVGLTGLGILLEVIAVLLILITVL